MDRIESSQERAIEVKHIRLDELEWEARLGRNVDADDIKASLVVALRRPSCTAEQVKQPRAVQVYFPYSARTFGLFATILTYV